MGFKGGRCLKLRCQCPGLGKKRSNSHAWGRGSHLLLLQEPVGVVGNEPDDFMGEGGRR